MMSKITRNQKWLLLAVSVCATHTAWAQSTEPFVYPKDGQTEAQQKTDEYNCHLWAVKQTGFNPLDSQAPAQVEAAPVEGDPAATGRAVAGGAVTGAAVGAFDGHAGQDALIGAVVGGLLRHRHERREQEAAQQQATATNNQANAAEEQKHKAYHEADNTCLKAKGYEVS